MTTAPVGLLTTDLRGSLGEALLRRSWGKRLNDLGITWLPLAGAGEDPAICRTIVICGTTPLDPAAPPFAGVLASTTPTILSGVTLLSGCTLDPLARCLLVAVRTGDDLARVRTVRDDVALVPLPVYPAPEPRRSDEVGGAVGLELAPQLLRGSFHWQESLAVFRGSRIVAGFTEPSPSARAAASRLVTASTESEVADFTDPDATWNTFGRLELLYTSSFAAAVCAVLRNVPVLFLARSPGEEGYFEERGLAWGLVRPAEPLAARVRFLRSATPDYRPVAREDARRAGIHLTHLKQLLEGQVAPIPDELLAPPKARAEIRFDPRPLLEEAPDAHRRERVATARFLLALEGELDRLHHRVTTLFDEVTSQCERIGELATEVDRLQDEVFRRENLIADMRGSRTWEMVTRLQETAARLRRLLGRKPGT